MRDKIRKKAALLSESMLGRLKEQNSNGKKNFSVGFNKTELLAKLQRLLAVQKFGILATLGEVYPYQSIVAFAKAQGLKRLFFATRRDTMKFANLVQRPRVTLFLDDRSNSDADLMTAVGVTAVGKVGVLAGAARTRAAKTYLRRHPNLANFLAAPECALCMLEVKAYYLVTRFQDTAKLALR
jgi:hypothetical protein